MACSTCVNLISYAGLTCGLVASILMFYFPPAVINYSENGKPYIDGWVENDKEPTDEEKRRAIRRIFSQG